MAYQDLYSWIRRQRARGLNVPLRTAQAYIEPALRAEASRKYHMAIANRRYDLEARRLGDLERQQEFNRGMAREKMGMIKDALDRQRKAERLQGIKDIGGGLLKYEMAAKEYGWPSVVGTVKKGLLGSSGGGAQQILHAGKPVSLSYTPTQASYSLELSPGAESTMAGWSAESTAGTTGEAIGAGEAAGGGEATGAAATTTSASTLGAGLATIGTGAGAGMLAGFIAQRLTHAGEEGHKGGEQETGIAAGAAAGAAMGSVAGPGGMIVGAFFGAIFGGGGGCIIVTACHGRDSDEVALARRYRDEKLDTDTLRGYYMLADIIVPEMEKDESFKDMVRQELVTPLLKVGAYELGEPGDKPSFKDIAAKEGFLRICKILGKSEKSYTRSDGEVI